MVVMVVMVVSVHGVNNINIPGISKLSKPFCLPTPRTSSYGQNLASDAFTLSL